MTYVLTLVSSEKPLTPAHLAVVMRYFESQGAGLTGQPHWLAPHKAADIPLANHPGRDHGLALRDALAADRIDFFITDAATRRKRLMLADMDSTIITNETLDDLADKAGVADKIKPITDAAMRGEMDFETALRRRVAMLKGVSVNLLAGVLAEARFNAGAQTLVATMKAQGALTVLVSGGFTIVTGLIARRAGFHLDHGNNLDFHDGKLTGTVSGPIVGREAKRDYLLDYADKLGIGVASTFAIGDGSNDLLMLQAAGLGVGYRPKPLLRESLDNCILYGDLTAALYAQGYRTEDFVTP